ncbi:biopolymer transporter ExbD [Dokdonia sp. PRO95]|uniref:ExbD/TolR family protein n=1 Tax=Dokdonia sp. PRO95 TaxID=1239415 RepID=UPI00054E1928|nr:biopolymer transporter ExbD [Dokdonia sp. PRO95]
MRRRTTPEVNAGSMADIAFLLLIFFLVTTTIEKDKGIARQLPPAIKDNTEVLIKNKNLFEIIVNADNMLLVENERVPLEDLRQLTIDFLDNGGTPSDQDGYCDYCKGSRDLLSSDNPQKAVISISPDRLTNYDTYISVQNEISSAYEFLRNREAQRLFGIEFTTTDKSIKNGTYKGDVTKRKAQIKQVRTMFPMLISEAETSKELRI